MHYMSQIGGASSKPEIIPGGERVPGDGVCAVSGRPRASPEARVCAVYTSSLGSKVKRGIRRFSLETHLAWPSQKATF